MKSKKELERLNEALKLRRTELIERIKQLEDELRLVEKNRDEICAENNRLTSVVNYKFEEEFAYCIFVGKYDNKVMFWNNGRFEDRFTNLDFSMSLDTAPVIDITYC